VVGELVTRTGHLYMFVSPKILARKLLPDVFYAALQAVWRSARQKAEWIFALAIGLRFILLGKRLPSVVLLFGLTPGDDLLCTTVLRELRKRGARSLLMMSNYPDIFKYNDDATYVTPVGSQYHGNPRIERFRHFAKIWRRSFRRLEEYAPFDFSRDQSAAPSRHIIAELCANAGIAGPVSVKPNLVLSSAEKEFGAWASGRIVIQSSGRGAKYPMLNKEWYPERFQAVVDSLCDEFDFVQLGSVGDPLLTDVRDLRGATSIRESASILFHAHLYIGTVGFLMHLARAVDCPSVIIFGGREAPWQSGYTCNVNLYTPVPCAPCWRWNTCEFDRRCMREITVDDVVRGVRTILSKPRGALEIEIAHI
jgi:hypothetical protein